MEDWIKIQSFDRVHQAEWRKELLNEYDIQAVVVNERDSMFLMGEIELYVKKEDEKRALALIEEFRGLTKVNSFILQQPLENLKDILDANEIYAVIKTCKNDRYVLDNYELFVRNEDVEKTVPFLTGEKLTGWSLLESCVRTRQTRFRIEMLDESGIKSIEIKKRDSEFRKEEINIYVKNKDLEKAQRVLIDLIGRIKVDSYDKLHRAEIRENILGKNGIRSLIIKNGEVYDLYVECNNEEAAIEIINEHRDWKKIAVFSTAIDASYAVSLLNKSGIDAVETDMIDSTFNFGEISVYVDDFNAERAEEVLKDIINNNEEK